MVTDRSYEKNIEIECLHSDTPNVTETVSKTFYSTKKHNTETGTFPVSETASTGENHNTVSETIKVIKDTKNTSNIHTTDTSSESFSFTSWKNYFEDIIPKPALDDTSLNAMNNAIQLLFCNPFVMGQIDLITDKIDDDKEETRNLAEDSTYNVILCLKRICTCLFDDSCTSIGDVKDLKQVIDKKYDTLLQRNVEESDPVLLYYHFIINTIDEYNKDDEQWLTMTECIRVNEEQICKECNQKQTIKYSQEMDIPSFIRIDNNQMKANIPHSLDSLIEMCNECDTVYTNCKSSICKYKTREMYASRQYNFQGNFPMILKILLDRGSDHNNFICGYPLDWIANNNCFPEDKKFTLYGVLYKKQGKSGNDPEYYCNVMNWFNKKWYMCVKDKVQNITKKPGLRSNQYFKSCTSGSNFNGKNFEDVVCLFYYNQDFIDWMSMTKNTNPMISAL